ncbi:MAG: NAD-dependent epimerase [Pseudomonadota bacterium]|nr:NAD-dependent epimerase [Pseudomonadota bacterium]
MHTAKRLLERGDEVVGIDNVNDYYDVRLKYARLEQLKSFEKFTFIKMDIADRQAMEKLFAEHIFPRVIHLAAQAGVRYSLKNPHAYIQSNVVGFMNILEGCRHNKVEHLVYASSSSVYGLNTRIPFSEHDNTDHPVSLYAATKKSNELMAHTYSHLYGLPTTGLRFFTVYGPWGRPDMAPMIFAKAIMEGTSIDVFNYGDMKRDFTYIDDTVEIVLRVSQKIPAADLKSDTGNPDPSCSNAPYRLYNIGNHQPVGLLEFIETMESELGIKAIKNMKPMQAGDVQQTYADTGDLRAAVGFEPTTPLTVGIKAFVAWLKAYSS